MAAPSPLLNQASLAPAGDRDRLDSGYYRLENLEVIQKGLRVCGPALGLVGPADAAEQHDAVALEVLSQGVLLLTREILGAFEARDGSQAEQALKPPAPLVEWLNG